MPCIIVSHFVRDGSKGIGCIDQHPLCLAEPAIDHVVDRRDSVNFGKFMADMILTDMEDFRKFLQGNRGGVVFVDIDQDITRK